MKEVFILSAVRSPIGRFGGALASLGPADLAAPVFRSALDQAEISGQALDLVILGHVLRGGHGQLVARQAAKKAGIPDSVDAAGIDMVCSSGMMSLMTGAAFIQSGAAGPDFDWRNGIHVPDRICTLKQGQVGIQVPDGIPGDRR